MRQYRKDNPECGKRHYQKHKESIAEYRKKYNQSLNGKAVKLANQHKRRRYLGHIPLNNPFHGCNGHHISRNYVIYIPAELHKSIWHSLTKNINMTEINKLAIEFLGNDPAKR